MNSGHEEFPRVEYSSRLGCPLNPRVGERRTILDREILWTERHKYPEELEPLRQVGDPLADECVRVLGLKPGTDALEALNTYLSKPFAVREFLSPSAFHGQITTVPNWVNWNLVKQAQDIHWYNDNCKPCLPKTYSFPINVILLHYSLVGGFSAARITKTLSCTKYFASPVHAYGRLLETLQFVIDCMKNEEALRCVTGVGWQSIIRVRLLHTQIRLRILSLAEAQPDYYSVKENGIPINQEDLVSTLCAFSVCVIMGLEKMGIQLEAEDVNAYFHLWRLIGFYMGIHPENDPLKSPEEAVAALESVLYHLVLPDDASAAMARSILEAVASKPPLRLSFGMHSAITRALLGDAVSDVLKIEKSSWKNKLAVALLFGAFRWNLACKLNFFLPRWIDMSRHYTCRIVQSLTEGNSFQFNSKMMVVPN